MSGEDPLLDPDYRYALNRFDGDGTTTTWNLTFAGGFIDREHVRAYLVNSDGSLTELGFDWISNSTVDVTPAVADGQEFVFYRDTPKNSPLVDFNGGSAFTERNLDILAKQAVFIGAETIDRFAGVEERTTAATAAAASAIVTANAADAKADDAIEDAETAIATANGAVVTADAASSAVSTLSDNIEDLLGADLSGLARLDAEQDFTARQEFSDGVAVVNPSGTAGQEPLFSGGYRLKVDGVWGSPRSYHDWDLLEGKPSTFPPSAHTQGWGTITDKPTTFPPSTHTHAYADITGKPTEFTPAAHNQAWSTITDRDNVRDIIFSTSAPSGGSDGNVWLRYV